MGVRTIRLLGEGYAPAGQAQLKATVDGTVVYNGPVPTINADPDTHTDEMEPLFSFDVPDTHYGVIVPSSFEAITGTIYVAGLEANNVDPTDLAAFRPLWQPSPFMKKNIRIDGVLIDAVEPVDGWHYRVDEGSVLEIDWDIPELRYELPGHPRLRPWEMVVGQVYRIHKAGITDFTTLGAPDNNPDTIFTCTATMTKPTDPAELPQHGVVFPHSG